MMPYYRIIFTVKEGKLLFTEIEELLMDMSTYESGSWNMPITKIVTPNGDLHFMAFLREYLEAMMAGIAVAQELKTQGWIE